MALDPKTVVELEIAVDPKRSILEINRFASTLTKTMKRNQKEIDNLGKGWTQVYKMFSARGEKTKALEGIKDQIKEIESALKDFERKKKLRDRMAARVETMAKGSAAREYEEGRLAKFENANLVSDKDYAAVKKGLEDNEKRLRDAAGEIRESMEIDWDEVGEKISTPFSELFSRDVPTIAKRIGKLMTPPVLTKAGLSAAKKLMEGGKEKWKASKLGGGPGAGLGTKAAGGLQYALGGLIKGLASLGPFIAATAGLFGSLIKVMLDAESAAKEYNKALLETTSTAGFLGRNFGNVREASGDLQRSLKAARDGAKDFSNLQWGITGEMARSFQSAITAEGVALDRLGKSTNEATISQERHTRTIQMGVAFSRHFGVSLSEIAQTQGQLMADLGMSGDSVTASFQQIADGAENAGMEANKFFGIVRSFSSDLSLFTLRLEDVSKIMGTLGKTMDPRKMGQFLQQLHQKFSGGIIENLKFEMMAEGGGGREILKADLDSKFKNITNDLKAALGDGADNEIALLMEKVRAGDKRAVAAWSEQRRDKVSGPVVEAITQLMIQNKRIASGDRIDAASVMEELSPLSKMEMLQATSMARFGKSLEDLSGIELAAAENAGIASAKEIQMYTQFHQGILQGQEGLLARMEGKSLTPDDERVLAKLNVEASKRTGKEAADELRKVFEAKGGERKYWDSLDKDQRDLLNKAAVTVDYQKMSADLQVSINEKLANIADILMNEIYKVLEWIGSLLPGGRDVDEEQEKGEWLAKNSGDAQLQKSWASGGDNVWKSRSAVIEQNSKRLIEGLARAADEAKDVQARLATTKDPGEKAQLEKRLAELKPAVEMLKETGTDVAAFKKKQYRISDKEALGGVPEMMRVFLRGTKILAGAETGGQSSVPGAATPKSQAAASVGPSASSAPAKAAKAAEEAVAQQQATVTAVSEVHRAVASDGVKLHPATVSGPLKDTMANSVYEGTSKALFEYFMYSALDRVDVATGMGRGMTPGGVIASVMGSAARGMDPKTGFGEALKDLPPKANAMGGIVTGIRNNMARISRFPAAPGEGWASVGKGEQIIPAGGGGGGGTTKVQLELRGDLRRLIDARVVEGAAKHDRNKRLR